MGGRIGARGGRGVLRHASRAHTGHAALEIRRVLRELRPEIVHTWTGTANRLGRLAAFAWHTPRVFASCRTQPNQRSFLAQALDRRLERWTERLVFNSQTVRDARLRMEMPHVDTCVIPNAVAPPARMTKHERHELRDRWDIPREAMMVAVVGPLTPEKQIKELIWATELLKVARQPVYLAVIGNGPHRWRLERYSRQVRVSERVRFVGRQAGVPRLLTACDCLWQASHWESCPNAVLEAMAASVPVIASDCAGHRELIRAEETGFLVKPGDRAGYARQMRRLIEDRDLAQQVGAAAQASVLSNHGLDPILRQYQRLYERGHESGKAADRSDRADVRLASPA